MRAGLAGLGFLLTAAGVLLVMFFWPVMAYETQDTFDIADVSDGETVRYLGTITDINQSGDIYTLELDSGALTAYTKDDGFEEGQEVLVTIEFGGDPANYDDNAYSVQSVPTSEGTIGLFLTLIGFVILVTGLALKKSTVEDIIRFEKAPPLPAVVLESTAPGAQGQADVEKVTCPNCKHVFGISGIQRPARITCPECGTSGIVE
jgi:hypothetical protein